MPIDLSTKCSKCGKNMTLEETRALGNGKFICKGCLEGQEPRGVLREEKGKDKISDKNFFEKKEYVCDDCHYKFLRSVTSVVEKCPFCGKPNVHEKVEHYADELLQEEDY